MVLGPLGRFQNEFPLSLLVLFFSPSKSKVHAPLELSQAFLFGLERLLGRLEFMDFDGELGDLRFEVRGGGRGHGGRSWS